MITACFLGSKKVFLPFKFNLGYWVDIIVRTGDMFFLSWGEKIHCGCGFTNLIFWYHYLCSSYQPDLRILTFLFTL